jgi:hypothetical protein
MQTSRADRSDLMSDYQECMTRAMQGFPKGISREERGLLFCANAKVCSGKISNLDQAKRYCQENPAAPKAPGTGRGRRGIDSAGIAQCLLPRLTNGASVSVKELSSWISDCSGKSGGIRIKKPESEKHFIKVCAMQSIIEQGLKGTFAESVRLQKQCRDKWKEKEAANVVPEG